jgi:hypothetical protein
MGIKKFKQYIEYSCEECGKKFGNKKDNYERHKNRKTPCIKKNINDSINSLIELQNPPNFPQNPPNLTLIPPKLDKINNLDNQIDNTNKIISNIKIIENICEFCNQSFAKKYNLDRHLNGRCKEKLKQEKISEEEKLIQEKIKLEDKIIQEEKFKESKELVEIKQQLKEILKQNKELAKNYQSMKKDNNKLKKQLDKKNTQLVNSTNNQTNIIVNNVVNNNNNSQNIVNFNNVDYSNVDKKLFINPLMNTRLFGKAIILQMIENIYINENLPEYQNIVITDKNRGYVKVFNNGKWKTDNIQIINLVIDGIISHSKTIWNELKQIYINNSHAKNRLNTSKKYIDLCDLEYLDELEDEQDNDDINNKNQIKQCKDFRDMVYKDTINLFHDNKNILLKPKLNNLIDL